MPRPSVGSETFTRHSILYRDNVCQSRAARMLCGWRFTVVYISLATCSNCRVFVEQSRRITCNTMLAGTNACSWYPLHLKESSNNTLTKFLSHWGFRKAQLCVPQKSSCLEKSWLELLEFRNACSQDTHFVFILGIFLKNASKYS